MFQQRYGRVVPERCLVRLAGEAGDGLREMIEQQRWCPIKTVTGWRSGKYQDL